VTEHADPIVSVVIPTRNGAAYLADQLSALVDQRLEGRFEVIVVDNGSTDETVAIALRHRGDLDLIVVDASACRGAAFARNVGAAAARAPRILFLDDDDVVTPGYVAAMAAALNQHEFVAARIDGRTLNPPWRVDMRPVDVQEGLRQSASFPWALSCALGVKRTAFDRVGGFDASFATSGEDVDLCQRMHEMGVELHLVTDAVVQRRLRTSRRALFSQGRRYATTSLRGNQGRMWRATRSLPGGLRLAVLGRNRSERTLGIYLVGRAIGGFQGAMRTRLSRTCSRAARARRDDEHLHEVRGHPRPPTTPE
jgi:glycosyltransferase involved in cell wall biosynthesis